MKKVDDAASRAAWAKQLVDDSAVSGKDPRDVLSPWDREMFFGGSTVQLRLPLRDPAEVRRHLELLEETVHSLRFRLEQMPGSDRSDLLTVYGVIRSLNIKLNALTERRRKVAK